MEFQLIDQSSSTKLVLDHASFPKGLAQHLAESWTASYWEPLAKALAELDPRTFGANERVTS